MDIKIGDRIRKSVTTDAPDELKRVQYGTVVYVHPKNRYYTVAFHGGKFMQDRTNETFCESYLMHGKGITDKRTREYRAMVGRS